jgi:hypothetical protein
MLRRNLRLALLLAAALMLFAGQAQAVTINFMVNVIASSAPSVSTGPASGSFTFSDTSPVISSSSDQVLYDTTGSATISLGGVSSTLPITMLLISNDFAFGGFIRDGFSLTSADEVSSRIWLDDTTGTALSGVSIPTSLDIADWNFMRFDITLPDGQVFGTLTSFTVPEPGILMLLVFAPLAVRALRK